MDESFIDGAIFIKDGGLCASDVSGRRTDAKWKIRVNIYLEIMWKNKGRMKRKRGNKMGHLIKYELKKNSRHPETSALALLCGIFTGICGRDFFRIMGI